MHPAVAAALIGGLFVIAAAIISVLLRRPRVPGSEEYARKYAVHEATMQYLSFIVQHANLTSEELTKFDRKCKDKQFLFKKDVQQFLEQLYTKGCDLAGFDTAMKAAPGHEQRSKLYCEKLELVGWFGAQFGTSKDLFARYLGIDKK